MRFALYLHNHQPAGNFDHVFEHAYQHSYLPLLTTLMKHPGVKFGMHNSGTLLEWIHKSHPEYFEMLKHAVKNQQVEILSSAYGEPILSLIPKKDTLEQIRYFNDYLFKHFNYTPKGLWLTERIWEPQLITTLLDAGIEYILLDDTHFFYAGLDDHELSSYYVTENEGRVLKVFPISMKLRYLIPFHPIEETFNFLQEESKQNERMLKTLGDDGEKFGEWPGTYDWVFVKGWLENFLQQLEQKSWLNTVFLQDIIKEDPAGRIYLPTSSYEEMGEWVLPPQKSGEYEELKNIIDEKYFYLLHGGYFKNFLSRYPEANHMHKRMLYVSRHIPNTKKAKLALWRGQCSCAYWHGIFGGLYLPHLREAVYRNLIQADSIKPIEHVEVTDFNADGKEEIVCSNQQLFAVLDPRTGSFLELDDRTRGLNLCNYLGRRREKYHRRIPSKKDNDGVRSIHETIKSKEANLQDLLIYDTYERRFGLDHHLKSMPTTQEFYCSKLSNDILQYTKYSIQDDVDSIITFSGNLSKIIRVKKSEEKMIELLYQMEDMILGIEFSLGIFNAQLKLDTGQSLTQLLTIDHLTSFSISADGFSPLSFSADRTFTLLSYPIETVSSSEAGFEKNFQGCCLMLIFQTAPKLSIHL